MIYNFDMVEILSNYIEREGVTIDPLVRIVGVILILHQKYLKYFHIPMEEMFHISIHIPFFITCHEEPNAPTGCYKLDH